MLSGKRGRSIRLIFLAILFFTLIDGFVSFSPQNQTGTQSSAQSPIFPAPRGRGPYTPFFDAVLQSVQDLMQPAYMRLRGWGIPAASATSANFGVTSTGSTSYPTNIQYVDSCPTATAGWNDRIYAVPITPTVSMTISSIGVNIQATGSGSPHIRVGVYNVSTNPTTLIAQSASTSITATGWLDVALTSSAYLLGGGSYALGTETDTASTNLCYLNQVAPLIGWYETYTYGSFPSTYSSTGGSQYLVYFRVTYTQIEGYTKGTRVQYTGATTGNGAVSSFSFYTHTGAAGDHFIASLYSDLLAPTRVQGPTSGAWSSGTSFTITLGAAPTNGNTLIATIGIYLNGAVPSVNSISQTGASWTCVIAITGTHVRSEIWIASGVSGAGTLITVNLSGATGGISGGKVAEYSNLRASSVDKTASSIGASSSGDTGTTAATTQANELLVGSIMDDNGGQSAPTNGFSMTPSSGANYPYLEKIVSSTGTANSGVTIGASADWAGCIATFLAGPAPYQRLWYSASTGSANTTWNVVTYASGTTDNGWAGALTQNAYYWFTWQWDNVASGPSYAAGSANSGIFLAQTYGTLLSTWSGGTLSAENWSMYLTLNLTVTENVTLTAGPAGAPNQGSVAISGCNPSPTSIAVDGASHAVTADPSCLMTLTVAAGGGSARDEFSNGGTASTTWAFTTAATGSESKSNTVYHQLTNTYAANANAQANFDAGMSWVASGTFLGTASSTICTVSSTVASNDSCSGYADYGLAVSLPSTATGAPASSRWQVGGASSFTQQGGGNTNNVAYYKQLSNTYSATPKSQATWDAGLTALAASGTLQGTGGQTVCSITLTGGGGAASCSGYADYGTAVSLAQTVAGAPANTRWITLGVRSWTDTTGGSTRNADYYKQFQVTFASSGISTDTAATVVTVAGVGKVQGDLPFAAYYNSSASVSFAFSSPVAATAGKQYLWSSTSGLSQSLQSNTFTVSSTGTVTGTFTTQYQVTYSTSGVGGDTSATVLIVNGTSYTQSQMPTVLWYNSGQNSTFAFQSPITGSSLDRYCWSSTGGLSALQSSTISMSAAGTVAGAYTTQYQLTMTLNGHGVSNVTAGAWYNSGVVVGIRISGDSSNSSSTRYLYNGATGSGTGGYTGASQTFQVTTNAPIAESIAWQTQYSLTTSAGTGGSVAPVTGWQNSGANVTITATADTNYAFASWTGTETGSYSGTTNPHWVVVSNAITESATFNLLSVSITVASNPTGSGFVFVDGNAVTTAQVYSWVIGSQHNLTAVSVVGCGSGCQYVFQAWNDTGARSHSITASSSIAYTATFQGQYQVVFNASGLSGSNTVVTVQGLNYTVGQLPHTAWYNSGASVSYLFASPVSGAAGTRYVWVSTGGLGQFVQSGSFAVSGTGTITGTYKIQYQLTTSVSPVSSGTVVLNPDGGWYDSGAVVNATESAGEGYAFSGWVLDGSGSGGVSPLSITMSGSHDLVASFTAQVTMTVSYRIVGGGSPTAPYFNYTYGGVAVQYTLTTTGTIIYVDQGTSWLVAPNPLSGSTGSERWSSNGVLSGASSTEQEVFTFYHQYLQTLSFSVAGGGSGYPAAQLTANQFGSSIQQPLTASPAGYWFDSGASWSATNPLGGSTESERWVTTQAVSGTVSSAQTLAFPYQHQYYLTMSKTPPTHGNVLPGSGWQNSEAIVSITALGVPGHTFASWSSSDPGGYTGQTDPSSVTMLGPVSETGFFNSPDPISITVTSTPTGAGYVVVDGSPITAPTTFTWGIGEVHNISANSQVNGNVLVRWSDGGAQSHNITLSSSTTTYTAYFGSNVQITVTSNPAGSGYLTVDGSAVTAPQTYTWLSSSLHNVTATGTVSGETGTRYSFTGWSDSGAMSHIITVPGSTTTYTANYQTQYHLTMNTGTGGSVSPGSSWEDAGAQVQIQATPDSGYDLNSWSGSGSGSYSGTANPHTITMSGPITESATFDQTVQVTIASSPTGSGYVSVDGTNITTSHAFTWVVASNHTVTASQTASCGAGCQYAFTGWSDSSARSHTVTAPSEATTITATFQQQYYLTMQAGSGGTATPSSGWHNVAETVQVQASPSTNYAFGSWTGSGTGSYSGTANPANVTMSGAVTESAGFTSTTVQVTVTSNPTGSGYVNVDGTGITTSQTYTWSIGSVHAVAATSPVACGSGCQYTFTEWSDSGAQSHNITASAATTVTATFAQQYYLTMSAGSGGSVLPSSGWYNGGTNVQISATPNSGYAFSSWTGSGSGSYTGTSNSTTVTVNGQVEEAAAFAQTQTGSTSDISSSTGVGAVTIHVPSGTLTGLSAISESSLPTSGKPDLQFPYGFFRFTITGITPGSTATITITLPTNLPAGAQYWKYQSGVGWVDMTAHMGGNNGGNTITLTITDGGVGDQDGAANGVIVDDGAPGIPANSGNGTVIVTGGPTTITSIQIDPGDGSNASAINVDTYYLIKVNVTSSSGTLSNVQRLELRLYQNSTTWPGNLDSERRQAFAWEYNGTWYQIGSTGWTAPDGTYFNATGSSHPDLSGSQGAFTFKVKVPKVSHYTATNGWNAQAWVEDKSSNQNTRTNLFAVNLYVHLTVPTTISWSATAGSSDVEASGMPFAIAYESNAVVKLQLNATNPASQYGDAFASTNLRISDTTSPHGAHSQALSTSLADWKTGLAVTDSGSMDAYWFVSVPNGQPTGTYTFAYNVNITFQEYAT